MENQSSQPGITFASAKAAEDTNETTDVDMSPSRI